MYMLANDVVEMVMEDEEEVWKNKLGVRAHTR